MDKKKPFPTHNLLIKARESGWVLALPLFADLHLDVRLANE
jgi:hypothetical protein